MAKRRSKGPKKHKFRNKLILNQWLISLFGIDPLVEHRLDRKKVRPFHMLAESINDPRSEGLDSDNLHRFYHNMVNSDIFWDDHCKISRQQLLVYEENIVRHTMEMNEKRGRAVVWKYFQWLTLLFTEIYLDRYFNDRNALLDSLNEYLDRFNRHWKNYEDIAPYDYDDLNKLCLQCATGSGKTLLMHVNLLQYRHYAKQTGKNRDLSRVILLTPNDRLSQQHLSEFEQSGIAAEWYIGGRGTLFTQRTEGLKRVDILEITKLADQEGPNTIATRSLGDQNLLLVDEGHRGMSGKEEGAWFTRRATLCEKGFAFEYSATFEQAVAAAKNDFFENSYAKTVLFDYSYRWFYEDGFGKDYQILNLPKSFKQIEQTYLTACLLKFYQQLKIYDDKAIEIQSFNLEKPLWVFVGNTVTRGKWKKDEEVVATDIAQVVQFISWFLYDQNAAKRCINGILNGSGQDTGLLDSDGNDIFAGSFDYLFTLMEAGYNFETLYQDILAKLFNNDAGGQLQLCRVKGDSGEIALKAGNAEEPFGLINVGDAPGLCSHCQQVFRNITVEESEFTETMFSGIKDSASPVNMLIGSKKFIEGWDCWRVSTMGLMHVGKNEGSQIIQLFGRGVRLKGYQWSLKRSGRSFVIRPPHFIEEIETLNVFGIEADFMERFRDFLKEEGLPGNERRQVFRIPLNVTYDFGKKLKIIRPKRKSSDGREYDFKQDGPVPSIGDVPKYLINNRVCVDWYPRIQAFASRSGMGMDSGRKDQVYLSDSNLALLDYDALYFELEKFKRERSWYNLSISKNRIRELLQNKAWYKLLVPESRLNPVNFDDISLMQHIAGELLKRYCEHYYNYCKRSYIEPRLEIRDLTSEDDNIPTDEYYSLIANGSEHEVLHAIKKISEELKANKDQIMSARDLLACTFNRHLYQPLFHVRRNGNITILPVALTESEFTFVTDLKNWCDKNNDQLEQDGKEIFLLRNLSISRGIGFFEAGNFHPDFILWLLRGNKQYITFIEPHGLVHEGPKTEKILFHEKIKTIEKRLGNPEIVLNSFILSWTEYNRLKWNCDRQDIEEQNVLFMQEDKENYIQKLLLSTEYQVD